MKETDKRPLATVSNYRHKKILEMLYQRQSVSADELATEFGVSKITIRRDLDALAGDKYLERTRGGAVTVSGLRLEEFFEEKDHSAKREKMLIGRYVAALVSENETVFVNAGSTTLEVVRYLNGKKVRVVTNNAACLGLDLDPQQELILLGGDYRIQSKSLVGDLTVAGLHSIFSSITVLGINGGEHQERLHLGRPSGNQREQGDDREFKRQGDRGGRSYQDELRIQLPHLPAQPHRHDRDRLDGAARFLRGTRRVGPVCGACCG